MDEAPGADEVDEPAHAHRGGLVEELTYEQHPGLPPAASKIFFSERRYAISGFGELAYTHYFGDKNRASGDIELFNTNLYRFVLYGAYRATDWLVLYAEVFAEFFHDGLREHAHELFVEAFVDFVISKPFGLRLGWFQVPIGYVNNNDEPIMFYSVNRPEVERLIIPTQWIELGAQAYGRIGDRASWLVGAFQGVQGRDLVGASWLRRGRENNVRMNFDSIAFAGQVNVYPIDGLSLSVSGMFAQSGNHERVAVGGEDLRVMAPTGILSGYARYETGAWSLMAMGVLGWMGQTDRMYHLTALGEEGPQILGARTYGYYFEVGFDLLHYLPRIRREPRETFLWRTQEMRLPLFVRYERLDTHDRVAGSLAAQMTEADLLYRSNLDILTFGANFNLRRNVVLKANYQVRRNRERAPHLAVESNRFETGLGFIF